MKLAIPSRWPLLLFLSLALAVRLAMVAVPLSYQADEIFQYLEQAHRLVFGYGVVPWEYRFGIRSWLFPVMLSAPMSLGQLWLPGTSAYLLLPKIGLIFISLFSVGAAYRLGRLLSPRHALVAVVVTAFWPEFLLFSGQALTDSVTVPLFLLGASFVYGPRSYLRWVAAGFLLALAAVLRFQYAPAIALFGLLRCRNDPRLLVPLALGGSAAIIGSMSVDLWMGTEPFGWILHNLNQNIAEGRASTFGVEGPFFYLIEMIKAWNIAFIPIVALAWFGSRPYPALFSTAVFNILLHSMIAHKEYRFILLSMAILVVLAALGSIEAGRRIGARRPGFRAGPAAIAAFATVCFVTTLPPLKTLLHASPGLAAFNRLRTDSGLCGVALYDMRWIRSGGYSYLHQDVPLYALNLFPSPAAMLSRHQDEVNAIVAPPSSASRLPRSYAMDQCYGTSPLSPEDTICIFRRPGPCGETTKDVTINAALRLTGN